MAYATKADIITIYSEDVLYVADRDGDGVSDDAAIERALSSASDEIDSYLGVRFTVPYSHPSEILTQLCVDMAIYRLANTRDVMTETIKDRYNDSIKHLIRISDGKATLPSPPTAEGEEPDPQFEAAQPIVQTGPERLFTREKTRGL